MAVERWVKANMKAFEFSQAMATADNVAKTLSGDCTEYAMLAAAMCRAVGVPSRTALGLVYAPGTAASRSWRTTCGSRCTPAASGCRWTRRSGMGGVGPGHVKIADHSWHDEKSFCAAPAGTANARGPADLRGAPGEPVARLSRSSEPLG